MGEYEFISVCCGAGIYPEAETLEDTGRCLDCKDGTGVEKNEAYEEYAGE